MSSEYERYLLNNWKKAEQLGIKFGITDNKSILTIWCKLTMKPNEYAEWLKN